MKTKSGKELSKLGIGTFGVGGRGHRDIKLTEIDEDHVYIDSLVHAFNGGLNFTEVSLGYGHGNALRLLKIALDKSVIKRSDFFITNSFYDCDLADIRTFYDDLESFYKIMNTDYADSTLVTQSMLLKFGEEVIYQKLHELLSSARTRYVSLTNASPEWIKRFKQEFGDSFFAHEGHLCFEIRALQDKGIFSLCDDLKVTNIIWRPLRRSKTFGTSWPLLDELSDKYHKTKAQIILNWMCHLGYKPMVYSTKTRHIDENIASTSFTMNEEDYQKMNDFRAPKQFTINVDWEGLSGGEDLSALTKI